MAPSSRDDLERIVFSTRVQTDQTKHEWQDSGALEIGRGKVASGKELLVVLYRVHQGPVFDITPALKCAGAEDGTFELVLDVADLQTAAISTPDLQSGFKIQVQSFLSDDPAFDGTVGGLPWQGRSCGFSKMPLQVMREGKKEISSDVKGFLKISPIATANGDIIDQPHEWAKDIFQDLMSQCLPQFVKEKFFPDLKPLGTFFAEKDLPSKQLPPALQDPAFVLSLLAIKGSNDLMFRCCGLHLLCKNLKNCDWLAQEYKDRINDKADLYFEVLTCSDNEISGKVSRYGSETVLAHQVNDLRSSYNDAVERSYFAAYLCTCPDLANFFKTADSLYQAVKETVASQNYKAHWLPETVDASNNNKAELMKMQLAVLRDKLVLLLVMAGKGRGYWKGQNSEIGKLIEDLGAAAKNAGLYGVTNMTIPPESFTFQVAPGKIISDDKQWHLQIRDMWQAPRGGHAPMVMVKPVDYLSIEADRYLSDEPFSLGLYSRMEPRMGNECVIL